MLNKIRWGLYIVWLAQKWVWRTTLMDCVEHAGRKWIITNGVPAGTWTLRKISNEDYSNFSEPLYVKHNQCKKIWSLSGCVSSFKRGYSFYMLAWYDIWCQEGIKEWMLKCNIW